MIKTVFFIVTAYGLVMDWAGPVPTMEICVEATKQVHQKILEDGVTKNGVDIPVEDIILGCYYTEQPVVGQPR